MYNDKNILVIIPARGGSKGVPRKNVRLLKGKPLIEYTLIAAKKSKYVNRVIVSTDDIEIANIVNGYGAEVPYLRPENLSDDNAQTIDVILHMLNYLKISENYIPDYVALLQCTSPLRNEKHIDEAFEKLINSDFDGIISICESEVNPYWTNVIEDNKLKYFIDKGKYITRRQDLPNIYRYNGAIFIAKTEKIIKENTFEVKNLTGYIMDRYSSVDIDNEIDFKFVEFIMEYLE